MIVNSQMNNIIIFIWLLLLTATVVANNFNDICKCHDICIMWVHNNILTYLKNAIIITLQHIIDYLN